MPHVIITRHSLVFRARAKVSKVPRKLFYCRQKCLAFKLKLKREKNFSRGLSRSFVSELGNYDRRVRSSPWLIYYVKIPLWNNRKDCSKSTKSICADIKANASVLNCRSVVRIRRNLLYMLNQHYTHTHTHTQSRHKSLKPPLFHSSRKPRLRKIEQRLWASKVFTFSPTRHTLKYLRN
jgi:hypothetical protein